MSYTVDNIVKVEFSDILNGEQEIATWCPVACAIKRLHSDAKLVVVGCDDALIWFSYKDDDAKQFTLGDSFKRFIKQYDSWPRWTRWFRRPFQIRIDYKNSTIEKL